MKFDRVHRVGEAGLNKIRPIVAKFHYYQQRDNDKKFRSFKSKENIHKKEVGPYRGFGYQSLISDPINLAKRAGG